MAPTRFGVRFRSQTFGGPGDTARGWEHTQLLAAVVRGGPTRCLLHCGARGETMLRCAGRNNVAVRGEKNNARLRPRVHLWYDRPPLGDPCLTHGSTVCARLGWATTPSSGWFSRSWPLFRTEDFDLNSRRKGDFNICAGFEAHPHTRCSHVFRARARGRTTPTAVHPVQKPSGTAPCLSHKSKSGFGGWLLRNSY